MLLPKGEIAHLTQPTRRNLRICLRSRAKGLYPKRSKPGYAFEFACVRSLPVTTASQQSFRRQFGVVRFRMASDGPRPTRLLCLVPGGGIYSHGCKGQLKIPVIPGKFNADTSLRAVPGYPTKTDSGRFSAIWGNFGKGFTRKS